ncbi:BTB-domain-containing protein [Gigaspora margarita]|uniref:BTB-domain-containing protein n=1 Tax=Gigaspora margarita TaxID=4874 RepID=A0A8H4ABV7_GIGMA|nr:BTB-domain-containing protein [Gigaspora margarita]
MISYRFSELSPDSSNNSTTNDPHDTLIEIYDQGSNNVKVFNAHSSVLCSRCEYFKIALSDKWAKKDDNMYKLRLEISCDAFEIIFKGICSGTIILKNLNVIISVELLLASDILLLQDFLDFLKIKLLEENKVNWRKNEIVYALKASYRISSLQELYLVCQDLVAETPSILFESSEFPTIDEELLIDLLKLDMICGSELIIFNKLIEWGIVNTPNYDTMSDKTSQLNALGATIEEGLQQIRYNSIKDFIHEYDQILPKSDSLYKLPPRIYYTVEPRVISNRFTGLIAAWINRKDPLKVQYTSVNNPFRFRHVFRMNDRTNFSSRHYRFHHYSNKLPTIRCHEGPSLMIMKIKNSGKFIGAYNPIQWKQGSGRCCGSTSESFIFSCDDKFGSNYRLSRVKNFDHAVCLVSDFGGLLNFGEDLMFTFDKENVKCKIKAKFYEPLTFAEGIYEIDEWNVYKVRRKDDQPMSIMTKMVNSSFESNIIDKDFFRFISTWIDKKDTKKDLYLKSNIPFQFIPIFRMNDHSAFYPKQFYNQSTNRLLPTMKCHHEPSLMLMKLKCSDKIIGAYNPLNWKYGTYRYYPTDIEYRRTSDSFIFSYEVDSQNETNYRLCRVVNFDKAIGSEKISTNRKDLNGLILRFGNDLYFSHNGGTRPSSPPHVYCRIEKNGCYEQPPILPVGHYEIDQWEIYRVSKKDQTDQEFSDTD